MSKHQQFLQYIKRHNDLAQKEEEENITKILKKKDKFIKLNFISVSPVFTAPKIQKISDKERDDWINLNPNIDNIFIHLSERKKPKLIKYLRRHTIRISYAKNFVLIKERETGVEHEIEQGYFLNENYKSDWYKPEETWRCRCYLDEKIKNSWSKIMNFLQIHDNDALIKYYNLRLIVTESFKIITAILNNFAFNLKNQDPRWKFDYIRINDNKSIIFNIGIISEGLHKIPKIKNNIYQEDLKIFFIIRNFFIHPFIWNRTNEDYAKLLKKGILKDCKKTINLKHSKDIIDGFYCRVYELQKLEKWKDNADFRGVVTNQDFVQYFTINLAQTYPTKPHKLIVDTIDNETEKNKTLAQEIFWPFNTLLLLDWFTSFILKIAKYLQ